MAHCTPGQVAKDPQRNRTPAAQPIAGAGAELSRPNPDQAAPGVEAKAARPPTAAPVPVSNRGAGAGSPGSIAHGESFPPAKTAQPLREFHTAQGDAAAEAEDAQNGAGLSAEPSRLSGRPHGRNAAAAAAGSAQDSVRKAASTAQRGASLSPGHGSSPFHGSAGGLRAAAPEPSGKKRSLSGENEPVTDLPPLGSRNSSEARWPGAVAPAAAGVGAGAAAAETFNGVGGGEDGGGESSVDYSQAWAFVDKARPPASPPPPSLFLPYSLSLGQPVRPFMYWHAKSHIPYIPYIPYIPQVFVVAKGLSGGNALFKTFVGWNPDGPLHRVDQLLTTHSYPPGVSANNHLM